MQSYMLKMKDLVAQIQFHFQLHRCVLFVCCCWVLFGMGGSCVHEGEKSSQVTCPGGKAVCHKAEKLSVQGSVPAAGLLLGGSPAPRSPVNKSKQAAMWNAALGGTHRAQDR